ncbi:MAG: CHAT domain-containing protein [Nocardiopsaceae bacterium]|nr:CHAT domain-containing protein [Nocardiopsaceae bacterium]
MPDVLRLEVREFTDLTRWRWTLTDAAGAFLADHEVRLDPQAERFEAFTALHDYVSWHAAPDKRAAEEARIVTGLGDWIGSEVFGDAIGDALVKRSPVTIQAILPPGAEALAYLPLEAARVRGRSLAGHGITLVIRPRAEHASAAVPGPQHEPPPGDRLRVLGLFSLPEGGSALNLRRERQSLVQLIRGIAAAGRAADIRVLQYGVTRDRLRDVLEEAEGWDVIHVSGHGTPGELVLETEAGTPDLISAGDLADLLDTARGRVRLVTLSACSSAALTANEQRRLLGLPAGEDQNHPSTERIVATAPSPAPAPGQSSAPSRAPAPGTLATELADRLGCAVLAMRFPVGDEFAIALAGKLYDLLARQGQPLPRAVALALSHLTYHANRRYPALSLVAPAIFGATAANLTLKAPERTGPASYATGTLKMAGFPPQPDRFVGRTAVMARSSAALAADSGVPGVLLQACPAAARPPAPWNSPTPTSTPSTASSGSRPPTRAPPSTPPSPTSPSPWNATSPASG